MHLRRSVKRKTTLLIQPPKPPEMSHGERLPEARRPEERPPAESSHRMEVPLPEDEDHDYESMSYIFTDLSVFFLHSMCI